MYQTVGFLWIGCNEVGFTADNVRAICRIGASTKKVECAQNGYIVEKGIGFKSVFKVADIMWVSSGALQFQFDKEKPLGMIAPEWCEFNGNPPINERTKFCFRIIEAQHRRIVQKDLLELKPELLLFLRQLRGIDVKIQQPSGALERSFSLGRADFDHCSLKITSLSRHSSQPSSQSQTSKFLVCQTTAQDMPYKKRRENVTASEVVIAFPITDTYEPKLQNCLTFNFLPIRSYGLPERCPIRN